MSSPNTKIIKIKRKNPPLRQAVNLKRPRETVLDSTEGPDSISGYPNESIASVANSSDPDKAVVTLTTPAVALNDLTREKINKFRECINGLPSTCLLYTSDAADE